MVRSSWKVSGKSDLPLEVVLFVGGWVRSDRNLPFHFQKFSFQSHFAEKKSKFWSKTKRNALVQLETSFRRTVPFYVLLVRSNSFWPVCWVKWKAHISNVMLKWYQTNSKIGLKRTLYHPGQFQKALYEIITAKRCLFLTTNFLQPAEFRRIKKFSSLVILCKYLTVNSIIPQIQIFVTSQYSWAIQNSRIAISWVILTLSRRYIKLFLEITSVPL